MLISMVVLMVVQEMMLIDVVLVVKQCYESILV